MHQKDARSIAHRIDPNQTAGGEKIDSQIVLTLIDCSSELGLHCFFLGLSVRQIRRITHLTKINL